jgi:hypothetical protein
LGQSIGVREKAGRVKIVRIVVNCGKLASIGLFLAAAAAAQTTSLGPRAPDGHPDFQGIWDNGTLTPLERGIVTGNDGKLIQLPPVKTLTIADSEAAAYEQRLRTADDFKRGDGSIGDLSGEINAEFTELVVELARVNGAKRTSRIVDPADGRIPYIATEEERKKSSPPERFDSVKDRPISERCLHTNATGPPIYNPFTDFMGYQIVQTPEHIMIMTEYMHEVRIVRMGAQHMGPGVRRWLGDSIGHWEGDTLVVDTTNFNAQTKFKGASENLHVVERFTPIDSNTILYRATVVDPSVFSKPWVIEYPFRRARGGRLYEDACHEGNYSLPGILKGARKAEADGAEQ